MVFVKVLEIPNNSGSSIQYVVTRRLYTGRSASEETKRVILRNVAIIAYAFFSMIARKKKTKPSPT